jgi:hypothetical protein
VFESHRRAIADVDRHASEINCYDLGGAQFEIWALNWTSLIYNSSLKV